MPSFVLDAGTTPNVRLAGTLARALRYTMDPVRSVAIDPRYPVTRMADLAHDGESTRTTRVDDPQQQGTPVIALDFGADVFLEGLSVSGCNFAQLTLETPNAEGQPEFVVDIGTDATDSEDQRRKGLWLPETPVHIRRYLLLTPTAPDPGATYYQISSLGAWAPVTTLLVNPEYPYDKAASPKAEVSRAPGLVEVGASAAPYLTITFPVTIVQQDEVAAFEQYLHLAHVPASRVLLWYENQDDLTKWYHVRCLVPPRWTRQGGDMVFSGFVLEEVPA